MVANFAEARVLTQPSYDSGATNSLSPDNPRCSDPSRRRPHWDKGRWREEPGKTIVEALVSDQPSIYSLRLKEYARLTNQIMDGRISYADRNRHTILSFDLEDGMGPYSFAAAVSFLQGPPLPQTKPPYPLEDLWTYE